MVKNHPQESNNKDTEAENEFLLEDINIERSDAIENALLQIGDILATTLLKTERYDEAMLLDELSGAFSYAAECYGEKTGRLRGDLGVSLSEATLMKTEAFRKNNLTSPIDNEWRYFVEDAKRTIENAKSNDMNAVTGVR